MEVNMANRCAFCEEAKPTNHLILGECNGQKDAWIEFCDDCGKVEMLRNGETGEEVQVEERVVDDRCQ